MGFGKRLNADQKIYREPTNLANFFDTNFKEVAGSHTVSNQQIYEIDEI